MKTAREIDIADYSYPLPEDRIPAYPLPHRADARQLVYRDGHITHGRFGDLPDRLPDNTLLIGNHTRVVHARLHFSPGEGKRPVEVFCLEPLLPHDYALSLSSTSAVRWKCLIGGNRRWKTGELSLRVGDDLTLYADRGERQDNAFAVIFRWDSPTPLSFGEVLGRAGNIPLPPYFNREAEAADRERYQTVFASVEGSVAAPTAGLHFTPEVLEQLEDRGIAWREITLHVGAGTFKPVTAEALGDHTMYREYFSVSTRLLEELALPLRPRPVVCVGTTSLRCIESLYYLGAQLLHGARPDTIDIGQWVTED